MMNSTNEDGRTRGVSTEAGAEAPAAERPKGKPGRKPKGSVPAIVAELPERPDPGHVLSLAAAQGAPGDPRTRCSAAGTRPPCERSARRSA